MISSTTTLRSSKAGAFTLMEMMVSVAIIAVMMLTLVAITQSVSNVWTKTSAKIDEFRGAREAFETITRQLRQATLNTYWDYDNPNAPVNYIRQSELRFIAGPAPALTQLTNTTGHSVFFQAPTGEVTDAKYDHFPSLLNTWGYYLSYGDDSEQRPAFMGGLANPPALRYRFRLMELCEPSDSLSVYKYTNRQPAYASKEWFTDPLKSAAKPMRVLSENVVALVLLPKLSAQEDTSATQLSQDYTYDSTKTNIDPEINPKNQLPPVVLVTMVAVDEASFQRYQANHSPTTTMPDFGVNTLFKNTSNYAADLQTLQNTLIANRLGFRVFTTTVSIKAAKWSRQQ